jgi:hypothetical protein
MTDSCQVYSKNDYESGDGMLTTVWGPSLWHYLHIISFNYPVRPSSVQKKKYREFIMNLKYTLPCKYCRDNLKNNLKDHPLTAKALKNRENFSKWMFTFHEHINKMLGKSSGLSFDEVRERYEHFRARCTIDNTGRPKKSVKHKGKKNVKVGSGMKKNKTVKKEKGCTEPLYGKKSKCVIKIVPQDKKCNTFQMDKKCKKTRKMTNYKKGGVKHNKTRKVLY